MDRLTSAKTIALVSGESFESLCKSSALIEGEAVDKVYIRTDMLFRPAEAAIKQRCCGGNTSGGGLLNISHDIRECLDRCFRMLPREALGFLDASRTPAWVSALPWPEGNEVGSVTRWAL
jgi:hypothetical protein